MKKVFALAVLFMMSVQVQAATVKIPTLNDVAPGKPVCFGREYSTPHMEAHPKQTVKKMRLKFTRNLFDGKPEEYLGMGIEADIVKTAGYDDNKKYQVTTSPYGNGMYCQQKGAKLDCSIECDGGHATVSWKTSQKDNEITFVNEGLILYGGCDADDDNEQKWIWLDPKKGGDDIFKMYALPAEYCQE
jgi:hypothetical protein